MTAHVMSRKESKWSVSALALCMWPAGTISSTHLADPRVADEQELEEVVVPVRHRVPKFRMSRLDRQEMVWYGVVGVTRSVDRRGQVREWYAAQVQNMFNTGTPLVQIVRRPLSAFECCARRASDREGMCNADWARPGRGPTAFGGEPGIMMQAWSWRCRHSLGTAGLYGGARRRC